LATGAEWSSLMMSFPRRRGAPLATLFALTPMLFHSVSFTPTRYPRGGTLPLDTPGGIHITSFPYIGRRTARAPTVKGQPKLLSRPLATTTWFPFTAN